MEWFDIGVARALVYLTLLPAAGLPLFALTTGRHPAMTARAGAVTAGLALLAGLASIAWLLASVAAMAAMPLAALDRETIMIVAGATPLGMVLAVRLAALLALALLVLQARNSPVLPALAGLAALATLAFTGHAGASEGTAGLIHRIADVLHLAGAAVWLSALAHFLAGAWGASPAQALDRQLSRFATTGTAIVCVLFASGLVNVLMISGIAFNPASPWGRLLLLKLALFGAMLCLAAVNRWRLTPALARGAPGARRRLRFSLLAELSCGLALVGVVALLGTLDPSGA